MEWMDQEYRRDPGWTDKQREAYWAAKARGGQMEGYPA